MRVSEIFLGTLGFTLVTLVWVFAFFVFDNVILKDFFKRKLQKRFKIED